MEQSTLDTALDTTNPAPAERSPAATGEVPTTIEAADSAAEVNAAHAPAFNESASVESAQADVAQNSAPQIIDLDDADTAEENTNVYVPQPELSESLSISESVEESERREVEGGRAYEIGFITRAGDAGATEAAMKGARALIEAEGGAIDQVSVTEVRRLAYPIKREIEGVYTFVNTRFVPTHLPEIDRYFKLEENVLRHMILRDEI